MVCEVSLTKSVRSRMAARSSGGSQASMARPVDTQKAGMRLPMAVLELMRRWLGMRIATTASVSSMTETLTVSCHSSRTEMTMGMATS